HPARLRRQEHPHLAARVGRGPSRRDRRRGLRAHPGARRPLMILRGVRVLGAEGLSAPHDMEVGARGGPETIDASGCILSPGWVDLHAHLRDPGFPEKETLASAARSAAAGGLTHVVAMANTRPV